MKFRPLGSGLGSRSFAQRGILDPVLLEVPRFGTRCPLKRGPQVKTTKLAFLIVGLTRVPWEAPELQLSSNIERLRFLHNPPYPKSADPDPQLSALCSFPQTRHSAHPTQRNVGCCLVGHSSSD